MIFVDTGAWFALSVTADTHHVAATQWADHNEQPLITTDFVVDETLTLLKARSQNVAAIALGNQLLINSLAYVYYLTEDDVHETWSVFRRFSDKAWSFTDCSSKVVMEKMGLTQAFAFDQHFRQFGSIEVVP